ncbi:hypothetical protein FHS29_001779 [Saccharothrix tamanrassetensis]|uniref:Secreted protein n=1 Tax=Saccharothrix tamanrassetensis TaxID=1051531 RepID=A0A841CCU9_9PSEU|nr:hypothetical protein [Saccharothrix tamanrassetensis]MBB5955209.1 hypothetical protein [Saccharothrix tamanrassetensis]
MRRGSIAGALAIGLSLVTTTAIAVPSGAGAGSPASVAAEPEWKALYASSDREKFEKLRVAVCASAIDPLSGKVTLTADVLQPDEKPTGNCVVGPVPKLPASSADPAVGPADPPADEDFGVQELGLYTPAELKEIEETRMMGCWQAQRITLYMSTGNIAFIDCTQPVEGEHIDVPIVSDGS